MWEAFEKVVPSKRHFAVGKETGLTSYIERLNNTLRLVNIKVSEKDIIILKEAIESYWGNWELHPRIQPTN